jgi:hypothetical protein
MAARQICAICAGRNEALFTCIPSNKQTNPYCWFAALLCSLSRARALSHKPLSLSLSLSLTLSVVDTLVLEEP